MAKPRVCRALQHHPPRTWANYYANERTPQPVAMLDKRSPLWDAEEVKAWHASRPGSPGRPRT